jgi:hypothetical protein
MEEIKLRTHLGQISRRDIQKAVDRVRKGYNSDLKSRIRNTDPIEIVKTIGEETIVLFGNLPNKKDLQAQMMFRCLGFLCNLDELLTDTNLTITKNFLSQIKKEISTLTEQDIHRIIMVLALSAYASLWGDKKTEELRTLIRRMRLIK